MHRSLTKILFSGTEYCGRRFSNAEELLVHVKTHTNLSTSSDPRALSILNASSPPPTSHHRFHPYARPLGVPHPASPSIPSNKERLAKLAIKDGPSIFSATGFIKLLTKMTKAIVQRAEENLGPSINCLQCLVKKHT